MPLYVGDYLAETGHLSTIEHGAYLLLLMNYWQQGGLPTDDEDLAIISRLPLKDWIRIRPKLARLFEAGWVHTRTANELASTNEKYERRAAAGKRGGIARATRAALLKPGSSNASSNGPSKRGSNVQAWELKQCSTNSHSTDVEDPSQEGSYLGEGRILPELVPYDLGTATDPGGAPTPTTADRHALAWDDDAPFDEGGRS